MSKGKEEEKINHNLWVQILDIYGRRRDAEGKALLKKKWYVSTAFTGLPKGPRRAILLTAKTSD